jgi:hypothetical protein
MDDPVLTMVVMIALLNRVYASRRRPLVASKLLTPSLLIREKDHN